MIKGGFCSKFFLHIVFLVLFGQSALSQSDKRIALISNQSQEHTQLKPYEIKEIFMGKMKRWPNGKRITVINQSLDTKIRDDFFSIFLQRPKDFLFNIGSGRIAFRTLQVSDSESMLDMVKSLDDGIGYVWQSEVPSWANVLIIINLDSDLE